MGGVNGSATLAGEMHSCRLHCMASERERQQHSMWNHCVSEWRVSPECFTGYLSRSHNARIAEADTRGLYTYTMLFYTALTLLTDQCNGTAAASASAAVAAVAKHHVHGTSHQSPTLRRVITIGRATHSGAEDVSLSAVLFGGCAAPPPLWFSDCSPAVSCCFRS